MVVRRRWRQRRRVVRRQSDVSRALAHARAAARLSMVDLGRALKLNPKTIRRWEVGEARPQERAWPAILAFYAHHAPAVAAALAASLGRTLPPVPAPITLDPQVASLVLARAADALDVAPKRVLEVLRAAAHAAHEAGVPIAALLRTVSEQGG